MIVPESHHLTYAATRKMNTAEELNQFKRNVVEIAGIDLNNGIEICPDEGDLLVFNPMALHSGSANATDQPRYVHFASFFDASATDLWGELRKSKYRDGFPDSLRENLPQYLLPLLEW